MLQIKAFVGNWSLGLVGCFLLFFHREEPGGCCLEGVFPAHLFVFGIIYWSIRGAGSQFSSSWVFSSNGTQSPSELFLSLFPLTSLQDSLVARWKIPSELPEALSPVTKTTSGRFLWIVHPYWLIPSLLSSSLLITYPSSNVLLPSTSSDLLLL